MVEDIWCLGKSWFPLHIINFPIKMHIIHFPMKHDHHHVVVELTSMFFCKCVWEEHSTASGQIGLCLGAPDKATKKKMIDGTTYLPPWFV